MVALSGDRAMFVDWNSIQQSDDDSATAETLVVHPDFAKEKNGPGGYVIGEESLSCRSKTHIPKSLTVYGPDGVEISERDLPINERPVSEDAGGYALFQGVCQDTFFDENVFSDDASAAAFGWGWARNFTQPPPIAANASPWVKMNPPPPTVTQLTLPTSNLAQVESVPGQGAFVEPSSVTRQGGKATIVVLWVDRPGAVIGGEKATFTVTRFQFDCTANTMRRLGSLSFTTSGKLLTWVSRDAGSRKLFEPTDRDGRTESAACGRTDLQTLRTFDGYAAAAAHVSPLTFYY